MQRVFRAKRTDLHEKYDYPFLALVLRKALQDRLEAAGHGQLQWNHAIDDLAALQEIELHVQGKGYRLRTETKGTLAAVFGACGVALPPTLQPM